MEKPFSQDTARGMLVGLAIGDDADTTGAVTGQLAGRLYGFNAIPERWTERLWQLDKLIDRADRLWDLNPTDLSSQRTPP